MRYLVVTSAALVVALSVAVAPASATTPASIDTTYGANGAAIVPGAAFGVTIVDASGRALVLGPTSGTGTGGQVTRFTATGLVDTTFGTVTSGTVASGTVALPAAVFYTRLALDSSGLVYALGSSAASGSASTSVVVSRLTTAGILDTTFGTGGTATVTAPAFVADGFTVRTDGEIVVSLDTSDPTNQGYLAFLTPAGALDAAFGTMASPGVVSLPSKQFVFAPAATPAPVAPTFSAASPPLTTTVGAAYKYTFAANGIPTPTFSVAGTGTLPTGLTLNAVTGVLSGMPTATGSFTFAVDAGNGVSPDAVTAAITIKVNPTPASPVFSADTPPTTAKVGTALSYTFTATGQPAPTFTVASGALPPGTLLSTSGVLSGTPTAGGSFTFAVQAANGVSPAAVTPTITITVAAAPVFTAVSPPPTGDIGVAYKYTFAASGNPAPTFTLAGGALPTGLALTPAGVLSGSPTTTGGFTFTVKATNGVTPNAVSGSLTITIFQKPAAPVFTADTPPGSATVGVAYTYTFAAGGNPLPTFTALGILPAGLTLTPAGVLSGKPNSAHTYAFRVQASNGVNPPAISPLIVIVVSKASASRVPSPPSVAGSPAAGSPVAATLDRAMAALPAQVTGPGAEARGTAGAGVKVGSATSALDPGQDVVALRADNTGATRTYAVSRYASDGTLDATFGTGGTTAPFPAAAVPKFVAEAPDGSYYVTGNDGQSVFLAHVLGTGMFDSAFGTGGILVGPAESCTPTGGLISFTGANIYVLAIDAVATGTCGPSPAVVLRFHAGALDTTFGAGGEVRIDSVAAMRVNGPNGGGVQPGGQMLVGLNGAAAPAGASAAVTRVNATAAGPAVEAFTQLVDDSHFGAAAVAPNPGGTYAAPLTATVDGTATTQLFAEGANNHLYQFSQTATSWSAPVDLTAATSGAPSIASAPKAVFDGTTIDVFALGTTGDLLEYRNNAAMGAWTTTDISAVAPSGSPKVTSSLDPIVLAGTARLYGVTTSGDLVEIDNDNAGGHPWNFYDLTVSAGGGTSVLGTPAALLIGTTPHVYTRAASNNHLIEYIADHDNGNVWNAYDTTSAAPAAPPIAGNAIPVLIGGTPHVYGASASSGDLIEYVADHLNSSVWNAYDQTSGANAPKPVGNPSVVLISGTPYGIAVPIPEVWETPTNGELTEIVADHVSGANKPWSVYDVTALSGGPQVTGDPTPIVNGTTVQVFGLGLAATGAVGSAAAAPTGAAGAPARTSGLLPVLPA